jgi:hypothetical protein
VSSPLVILVVVLAAAALAWWLRKVGSARDDAMHELRPPVPHEPEAELVGEDEIDVALTSDGEALIPFGRGVRVVLVADPAHIAEHRADIEAGMVTLDEGERAQLARSGGTTFQVGDLTGARVTRGTPGHGLWRVETLGRDGDYGFLPFETEEGARAALDLLTRAGVVRRPLDEEGRTIPASLEDFEEARRQYEETERAMELGIDDEPAPPRDWSDRR